MASGTMPKGWRHSLESQPGLEVCHGPHVGLGVPAPHGKRSWLQDGHEFAKGIIFLMSHKS